MRSSTILVASAYTDDAESRHRSHKKTHDGQDTPAAWHFNCPASHSQHGTDWGIGGAKRFSAPAVSTIPAAPSPAVPAERAADGVALRPRPLAAAGVDPIAGGLAGEAQA